jgi:hypothetical protein
VSRLQQALSMPLKSIVPGDPCPHSPTCGHNEDAWAGRSLRRVSIGILTACSLDRSSACAPAASADLAHVARLPNHATRFAEVSELPSRLT